VLAYVFWHRRRDGVEPARYEESLRRFHDSLDAPSASFRLLELPFAQMDGYEDWYLIEDWQALGALNADAVDDLRRDTHDTVAQLAGAGWGAVYALVRGAAEPPAGARWLGKPTGRPYDEVLAALPNSTVWQRQLVLGPAPEFCVADGEATSNGRERLF
jgi:hypothetical protein